MAGNLEDLEIYKKSLDIADEIWDLVNGWKILAQDTMGKQVIRSSDSIAVNISEGYGRYFFKDRRLFFYYSRGSIKETRTWLLKSFRRKLVSESQYKKLDTELEILIKQLNSFIKSFGKQ